MKLVDHIDKEIDHDDLGRVKYSAPGLVTQLKQALANSRETTVKTNNINRVPLSLDAFDLLRAIDLEVNRWGRWTLKDSTESKIIRVSATVCTYGVERAEEIEDWCWRMGDWVVKITYLFDPPTRYHISAQCPDCGKSSVRLYHMGDKEWVQVPALQIFSGPVCKCLGCGAEWPEDRFLLLARAIGCQI
jgi:hypothetical protein